MMKVTHQAILEDKFSNCTGRRAWLSATASPLSDMIYAVLLENDESLYEGYLSYETSF